MSETQPMSGLGKSTRLSSPTKSYDGSSAGRGRRTLALVEVAGTSCDAPTRTRGPAGRGVALDARDTSATTPRRTGGSEPGEAVDRDCLVVRAARASELVVEVAGVRIRPSSPITVREAEVAALVSHGLSNAQVGQMLCVSETTIKFHLAKLMRKLSVSNRVAVAAWAWQAGLPDAPDVLDALRPTD